LKVTDDEAPCAPSGPDDGMRVAEALRTQETFTRDQVAWIAAQFFRWGYERHRDEENENWPPAAAFVLGRWFDQAVEREKADAAARLPRPTDFRGRGMPDTRAAA
jgi:hypothetical protein